MPGLSDRHHANRVIAMGEIRSPAQHGKERVAAISGVAALLHPSVAAAWHSIV